MKTAFLLLIITLSLSFIQAEEKKNENKDSAKTEFLGGLKWRSIGPAYSSGRISDFAVNPQNPRHYYIAVSSGNIWRTVNSGTTFEPVFDTYGSYSIGCLAMDPDNPYTIWAGTGENNHQRALGYGDGVYKSTDGGTTWKNMGLKNSRQIGEIAIDPRNPDIIFVAAEGSVWASGEERGLYKSTDGGNTWKKTLHISEHTGVNNIIYDPRNPDVMYATSEQRRRHVFTKIGGGPESAVYKSVDAGENWEKIMTGLPSVDIGGMDIAISPANPDILYIIMEAAEKKGGFFRSTNRGASWERMNEYTAKGQYFNEIYCDPKNVDKVYSMDVVSKITLDGGKTWQPLGLADRHVDDHAMWIDPGYTDHFLIGGDGGIYETFDGGKTYDFKENLPVTQFYRVNVDNSEPFYYVYGGTQDNNSVGGPSNTISTDGIVNNDWFVTNGGDGFWTAVDPENQDIVYAEAQYGNMVRYDRKSGEAVDIRPEPGKDELTYKWNWNTPLFISPHNSQRLYCAAERVFRSNDRGDSWDIISGDLTTGLDRNTWKVMDKYWSIDAVEKDKSTSLFGTIISLAESPVKENLLYAGTDDGVISVTQDGRNWIKITEFPGIPEYTYVSDICPSRFDENVVFASFDNILRDDFKPYILRSNDKGKSWKSISGDLPENGTVHSIEQDFINPDLLFAGTEFGFFFTTDGGKKWMHLKSGLPTIAVKDIAIQQRENDIVIATFGRGFYVLDNYSPLRELNAKMLENESYLFPVKDALLYVQGSGRYGQGSTYFKAPNRDFGAVFTYYIKEVPNTLNELRKKKEKELFKDGKKIDIPGVDEIRKEKEEIAPYLTFSIYDNAGRLVRKISKAPAKGINRAVWDLRYASTSPVTGKDIFNPTAESPGSSFVLPGEYTVTLTMTTREGNKALSSPVKFNVVPLNNTTLPAENREQLVQFQVKANELARSIRGAEGLLNDMIRKTENIKNAVISSQEAPFELLAKADVISGRLKDLSLLFRRSSDMPSVEETPPSRVTFNERLGVLGYTHWRSTSAITRNEHNAYDILIAEFPPVLEEIKKIYTVDLKNLEDELENFNVPWTPGRIPTLKVN
jgi:photosystem II stability/assembly factor-like uncharacterized protein